MYVFISYINLLISIHFYFQVNDDGNDKEQDHMYDDMNYLFNSLGEFPTRIAAEDEVRRIGRENHMYFTVVTAHANRIYLGCERSGKYRATTSKNVNVVSRHSSGTKKNECPFQLKLKRNCDNGPWVVRTSENRGRHNHALGKHPSWHTSAAKLSEPELEHIHKLYMTRTKPKSILQEVKLLNKDNVSNIRHVYNAIHKNKNKDRDGLTTMQYFLKLLSDHHYYHNERKEPGNNHVGEVFFAHHHSVDLVRLYPYVILLDATYATNLYNMPLVQVMGLLPTGKNFHVAFACIYHEKEDSYVWIMRELKKFFSAVEYPGVFVTDREQALMNAIDTVFPESGRLLCRRHISECVHKNFVKHSGSRKYERAVRARWKKVVNSQSVDEYEKHVDELLYTWRFLPLFGEYVKKTWCDPHHENFVSYWTRKYLHFGTQTTNRYH